MSWYVYVPVGRDGLSLGDCGVVVAVVWNVLVDFKLFMLIVVVVVAVVVVGLLL